ncbi:MAG TPA: hypothetical protein PKD53_13345 [Chloroflexaceae bacterium]|nr:hypothetical protein [Chloroflexaceae bacterium]
MWLTIVLTVLRSALLALWFVLKPVLGWLLIVIGLIGMPMPIMNGVIFLVIGLALVGHRNRLIRWSRVQIKLLLVWWSALDTPLVGPLGRLARRSAQTISRQHRRMRWWFMDRRARKQAALAEPGHLAGD